MPLVGMACIALKFGEGSANIESLVILAVHDRGAVEAVFAPQKNRTISVVYYAVFSELSILPATWQHLSGLSRLQLWYLVERICKKVCSHTKVLIEPVETPWPTAETSALMFDGDDRLLLRHRFCCQLRAALATLASLSQFRVALVLRMRNDTLPPVCAQFDALRRRSVVSRTGAGTSLALGRGRARLAAAGVRFPEECRHSLGRHIFLCSRRLTLRWSRLIAPLTGVCHCGIAMEKESANAAQRCSRAEKLNSSDPEEAQFELLTRQLEAERQDCCHTTRKTSCIFTSLLQIKLRDRDDTVSVSSVSVSGSAEEPPYAWRPPPPQVGNFGADDRETRPKMTDSHLQDGSSPQVQESYSMNYHSTTSTNGHQVGDGEHSPNSSKLAVPGENSQLVSRTTQQTKTQQVKTVTKVIKTREVRHVGPDGQPLEYNPYGTHGMPMAGSDYVTYPYTGATDNSHGYGSYDTVASSAPDHEAAAPAVPVPGLIVDLVTVVCGLSVSTCDEAPRAFTMATREPYQTLDWASCTVGEEDTSELDIGGRLGALGDVPFEEYIATDSSVETCSALSDVEIVEMVRPSELSHETEVDDDDAASEPLLRAADVAAGLAVALRFFAAESNAKKALGHIYSLQDLLSAARFSKQKKTAITDFFS
ncbi:hypothetical protein HPB51_024886 [Rhipicephalus microplus]|uniref:Uncharacterized protein n=1 Tax=Rhipicephalus microplus TaxID=6941 RepID=A0A9J6EQK2_RHIMP|nr:hypothetical protein HPB51_024886 [Rhipicephalus microplus]